MVAMAGRAMRILKWCIVAAMGIVCAYSFLNSATLLFWGDPSARGIPRMFHPPEIMILHYTGMISPVFAEALMILLYWGAGFGIYFGIRRINRGNVLDHPLRAGILDYIRNNPGRHFRSIMRETGVNRGTLYYHINRLKAFGKISEMRDGGLTRYYERLNGVSPLERTLDSHRGDPKRDEILGILKTKPGITAPAITEEAGIPYPSLWYHLQILEKDGVVRGERDGRNIRYVLTPEVAQALSEES